jgi:hypothetical protein
MTTDELLSHMRAHITQMAPHQKVRKTGTLLMEAEKEIERLRLEVAKLNGKILGYELDEFHPGRN